MAKGEYSRASIKTQVSGSLVGGTNFLQDTNGDSQSSHSSSVTSYYFIINNFQETIGHLGKIVLADPDPDGHVRRVTVEISRRGKNSDDYDKHHFKRSHSRVGSPHLTR